ncbi:MAG: pyridoxamine 5'-phosphate oxidase family protein [Actinomycetota bacterium]
MKLTDHDAQERLARHDHGILCTIHRDRGTDAVPVVYALHDGHIAVPIDRVKPKSTTRLQRERNLDADPRATLLIEHWNRDDWSQLWWVRAGLVLAAVDPERERTLGVHLARRYRQYRDQPFRRILVFRIDSISGWGATT